MKNFNVKLSNGEILKSCIVSEELIFGATAIATNCNFGMEYEGICKEIFAFNPITNEKIDILYLKDEDLSNYAKLLVPLHDKESYELAKKHDLKLKQVVAPYFEGVGETKFRPELPEEKRHSVIAIVEDKSSQKYLCEIGKNRDTRSFVLGGVEGDETPELAAKREIEEETGYYDIQVNSVYPIQLHNHFFAKNKGINRYSILDIVFCELKSEKRKAISEEENLKCSVLWVEKGELKEFLNINNNLFACDVLLNNQNIYEGDGKMVNSSFLNGKNRKQAKETINTMLTNQF